jgi:5-deoxy-glucuronate isomerase
MNLLIKPKKDSQQIVSVTPASAGWRYVSFSAYRLAPGGTVTVSDNSNELCAVVLSGIVSAQTEDHDWSEIGRRMSVFEDAAPSAVNPPSPCWSSKSRRPAATPRAILPTNTT